MGMSEADFAENHGERMSLLSTILTVFPEVAARLRQGDNLSGQVGGERGIRTLVTVSRKHAFQACAFNHSATSPPDGRPLGAAGGAQYTDEEP
jgi:hypothetical protein